MLLGLLRTPIPHCETALRKALSKAAGRYLLILCLPILLTRKLLDLHSYKSTENQQSCLLISSLRARPRRVLWGRKDAVSFVQGN